MATEQNIAVLRRWLQFADAGFSGDFGEFISRDYSGHLSGRIHMDLPELQPLERAFAAAFAEVTRTIEDLWGVVTGWCCGSPRMPPIAGISTASPRPAGACSSPAS